MAIPPNYWDWWNERERLQQGDRPATRLGRMQLQLDRLVDNENRVAAMHVKATRERERLEKKIAKVAAILQAGKEMNDVP